MIAYTKSDKSDANLDRVRTGLSEIGVVDEAWGGDFTCIPVSSKTGEEDTDHVLVIGVQFLVGANFEHLLEIANTY